MMHEERKTRGFDTEALVSVNFCSPLMCPLLSKDSFFINGQMGSEIQTSVLAEEGEVSGC